MKKLLSRFIVVILVLLFGGITTLLLPTCRTFQTTSKQSLVQTSPTPTNKNETPNEKFKRKGGKITEVSVITKADGELTTENIEQDRDLSLYDKGGYFNCNSFQNIDRETCKKNERAARDFIWQHWKEKRQGYLSITYNSIDAVSTSHIFIEPKKQGSWHVAWRIVRHSDEVNDMPDLVAVERIENAEGKNSYSLVFRDKDGDVSRIFPSF